MKKLLALFFVLAAVNASSAQGDDVAAKNFDREKWKEIVGNETFEENPIDLAPPKPPPTLRNWNSWFSLSGELLRAVAFILAFLIFAYILYFVAKNTSTRKNIRSMKPVDITAPLENIEELDTDALLRKALADGDFRLAVRVHYILLLKKLNEVGLIIWKKDKTNRDYLSELYGRDTVYDDVRKLTIAYELVWYGERSVSQESFQRISGDFDTVNKHVVNVKASE